MNTQKPQSFFDARTLMAIALTTFAWMGWQWYMQQKYPQAFEKKDEVAETKAQESPQPEKLAALGGAVASSQEGKAVALQKRDEITEPDSQPETLIDVSDNTWKMLVSSRGMGLREIELKKYKDRDGQPIRLGGEVQGQLPLETALLGTNQPLHFVIQQVSPGRLIGRAQSGGLQITKTLEFVSSQYKVNAEITVTGEAERFLGLSTLLVEPLLHLDPGSIFAPQVHRHEFFVSSADGDHRFYAAADKLEEPGPYSKASVAAVGSHYFAQAILDRSDVIPEVRARISGPDRSLVARLDYSLLNRAQDLNLKFTAFLGPKNLDLLKAVDAQLAPVVDFGFFAFLGRPILKLLKWFHEVVGNWGVAIIILTIVVRFIVLPFNVMSFRSMQAMQALQPKMQILREKYKEDKERLNQEMMVLFRDHKVNPLGGCLPVLLQIPIFMALYQVLGHSVELYQAPFFLWIHDLSSKDPYYVLPVLMGITMFVQQKITPTTMDPAQAKVMLAMPVIFSLFMLALPSGLTLYIFVGAIFAIIQQIWLMKSSKPQTMAKS